MIPSTTVTEFFPINTSPVYSYKNKLENSNIVIGLGLCL